MIRSGYELILEENREVREKHGFSLQRDREFYENGELVQAGEFCLEQAKESAADEKKTWPEGWNKEFELKIRNKNKKGKLIVAGSFFYSEFQRTGDEKFLKKAKKIARQIDKIHL